MRFEYRSVSWAQLSVYLVCDSAFSPKSVEELAMGDEGWCYQPPVTASNQDDSAKKNPDLNIQEGEEGGAGAPTSVAEIRRIIVQLAKREDR